MSLMCLIGMHKWDACKCSNCGKTHDESHAWAGCKCSKCGKTRDEGHDWTADCEKCATCGKTVAGAHEWSGCKCSKCGKTRDEDHAWSGCKCVKCGQTRDEEHSWAVCECSKCYKTDHVWDGCKCSKCGKTRNEDHAWAGCQCSKCGSMRDEGQDWSKDPQLCAICGITWDELPAWERHKNRNRNPCNNGHTFDGCKCSQCGKIEHAWDGCRCSKCGKTRDEDHAWVGCECSKCGKTRDEGHVFINCQCYTCGKTNHMWDGCRCSKCGKIEHAWIGCQCSKCGKIEHAWHGGKCANCGKAHPDYIPIESIRWQIYNCLDSSDMSIIEQAISGNVDESAVASVLYKIYKYSYLFNYANDKTICSSGDCGMPLFNSRCPICRRTFYEEDFNSEGRHKAAVVIGKALWNAGGLTLMESVLRRFPEQRKSFVVSHAWDRIGRWFA